MSVDHPPLGWVVDARCGELTPYTMWQGATLLQWATEALVNSGVEVLDARTDWSALADYPGSLVITDIACPGLDPRFVRAAVQLADSSGQIVVAARPVTDTIKSVNQGWLEETVDRAGLLQICAPVVIAPPRLAEVSLPPNDLVRWVASLPRPELVEAPVAARRISTLAELDILAAG